MSNKPVIIGKKIEKIFALLDPNLSIEDAKKIHLEVS